MPRVRLLSGGLPALLLLLGVSWLPCTQANNSYWSASVNITYSMNNHSRSEVEELGLYGQNSPRRRVQGQVAVAEERYSPIACDPSTNFTAPAGGAWIALIERGACTFTDKIRLAATRGAIAVVIFNNEHGNRVNQMSHPGTDDTVAIMIGHEKGREILTLINKGIQVSMVIEAAKRHGASMSHYSIFFVSMSFFIVTAATVGYFIFYSARRLRLTRAQNRKLKKLKADAKRAISQLQLRTLKHGDMAVSSDGDSCAVCIENYKHNDTVRILTCNHFFHKACIDPWLLEHRTCPMCKCDILKALGIEVDVEEGNTNTEAMVSPPETPDAIVTPTSPAWTEEDTRSEAASSGYASVRGMDDASTKEETAAGENTDDHTQLVNNLAKPLEVKVLPPLDNPSFEEEDEAPVRNPKT